MKSIFNIAQTTIKGLAAGALLSTALLIPSPEVKAEMLYQDPYGRIYGGSSYNLGRYHDNTLYGDGLYGGGVITDSETGTDYNCDTLGNTFSNHRGKGCG